MKYFSEKILETIKYLLRDVTSSTKLIKTKGRMIIYNLIKYCQNCVSIIIFIFYYDKCNTDKNYVYNLIMLI